METYWKHRTNKGKVVYRRKPSVFTLRDVLRILSKIDFYPLWFLPDDLKKIQCILLYTCLEFLRDVYNIMNCNEEELQFRFGGGEFGGGGATRPW